MNEIWKDVEGFEGIYQVSNCGNVKRLPGQCGTAYRKERILSKSLTHDGYEKVRLIHNEKDATKRVHRIVAEAFVPNPDGKETVNHIDGNKRNNFATNLEWMDRHEQLDHAYRLNLKTSITGEDNANAKLTKEQVDYIRQHYKKGSREFGSVALAKRFDVSHRVILLVAKNESYKDK